MIAGILAVEHFARTGQRLPFGIDVLAFGDEEGSRFPSAMTTFGRGGRCIRSRNAQARRWQGHDACRSAYRLSQGLDRYKSAYQRDEALAYVEVHIEQGPVLEAESRSLGVVTAIVGQQRMRVTVTGRAGHAGTVPIKLRQDALLGAAEMVLAVEALARSHESDGMVATVGRIEAFPGAVNVIPGRVTFTVDVRSADRCAAPRRHAARGNAVAADRHRPQIEGRVRERA